MKLEYDLSKQPEQQIRERRRELQEELSPRSQCRNYIRANGDKAVLVTKEEFDKRCRDGQFSDGPFKDSFGDGSGEPYNPNRQIFGKLKSGEIAYCEASEANIRLTSELFDLVKQES